MFSKSVCTSASFSSKKSLATSSLTTIRERRLLIRSKCPLPRIPIRRAVRRHSYHITSLSLRGECGFQPNRPTVLITELLGDAGIELLQQHCNVYTNYDMRDEELLDAVVDCDALIVRGETKVTRKVFEASQGRLKVVGRGGVGIENVDIAAATEVGCLVVNAPTSNTVAAAEHCIALLCSVARSIPQACAFMKAGKWDSDKFVGITLTDKTLAVIGFGKVGTEVARRAKGLGMRVMAYDPYAPRDRVLATGAELCSFDEALECADFITLHTPLTSDTAKLFSAKTFAKCKRGVRIVNIARGGVIDERALADALEAGAVAAVALDVFSQEPPLSSNPLIMRPDVICTPHLGSSTIEAQEGMSLEVADAVLGALRGELSSTAVNAPMVPAEVLLELSPHVSLAERLGRIAVQLVESGVQFVTITYTSPRGDDLDTRLLRAMVIKGLVEPVSSRIINLVNADFIAKQRGLVITEEIVTVDSRDVLSSVSIQVKSCRSRFSSAMSTQVGTLGAGIFLSGSVKAGVPHLSRVGDFDVDVSLAGEVLLCRQQDQPGVLGAVGHVLAREDINISFMSVARSAPRTEAIMAIGIDDQMTADLVDDVRSLNAVEEALYLSFSRPGSSS